MLAVNENLLHILQHRVSPVSLLAAYCHTIGNSLRSNDCAALTLHITQAFDQTLFQFQQALSMLIRRVTQVQGSLDGIEIRLEVIRDLVAMENGVLIAERSDILTGLLASDNNTTSANQPSPRQYWPVLDSDPRPPATPNKVPNWLGLY